MLDIANMLSQYKQQKLLGQVIEDRLIESVFQPIVNIQTGSVTGYESLSRCTQKYWFATPEQMFATAQVTKQLYELETLCRTAAILKAAAFLGTTQKLFLNINPEVINDPAFVRGRTLELITSLNLPPQSIVFEITERTAIKDFKTFHRTLNHYRNQGYLVAIDDAGAGYSSLQAIAELSPDYIKLDRSIIEGCHVVRTKQALIEAFVTLADKLDMTLIAEGIETPEELTTLINLGVMWAQGYFLARPAFPVNSVNYKATYIIKSLLASDKQPSCRPALAPYDKKTSAQHDRLCTG